MASSSDEATESFMIIQQSQEEYNRERLREREEEEMLQKVLNDSLLETNNSMRETTSERQVYQTILQQSAIEEEERLERLRQEDLELSRIGPKQTFLLNYPPGMDTTFLRKQRYFLQRKLDVGLTIRPADNQIAISYTLPHALEIAVFELQEFFAHREDTSGPHPWLLEVQKLQQQIIHVFIDNSNIYHSAQNVLGPDGQRVTDMNIRLKAAALAGLVINRRQCGQRVVFGSKPPSTNGIWTKWQEAGFEVHLETRAPGIGETFVDDATVAMINSALIRFPARNGVPPRTLVLLTGDGNANDNRASFVETVDNALRIGWRVELWTWRHSVSSKYLTMQKHYSYSGLFSLNFLDEFRSLITFKPSNDPLPHPSHPPVPRPPVPHSHSFPSPPRGPPAVGGRGRGRGRDNVGGRGGARGRAGRSGRGFNPTAGRHHPGGRSSSPGRGGRSSNTAAATTTLSNTQAAVSAELNIEPTPLVEEGDDFEILEADINLSNLVDMSSNFVDVDEEDDGVEDDDEDYTYMTCPLSLALFEDPVRTPNGHYFERALIESWIGQHGNCPLTRNPLSLTDLSTPSEEFLQELASYRSSI